jgi:hypothetical protein
MPIDMRAATTRGVLEVIPNLSRLWLETIGQANHTKPGKKEEGLDDRRFLRAANLVLLVSGMRTGLELTGSSALGAAMRFDHLSMTALDAT